MAPFASPHITLEQWQSGEKTDVDVFEDQYRSWSIEQARLLAPGEHSGPAILTLLTPLFEALAQYLRGRSSRGDEPGFLRAGLEAVFPDVENSARELSVKEVRHGLAHEAMFRRVLLHRGLAGQPDFGIQGDVLVVNPWWVLERTEQFFDHYVAQLRRGEPEMLARFEAFMRVRKQR